ncbi:hypothetical protein [Streptomyces sp. TR06-5]|uniref:hypothetical protein n=1 Tax=unclassified Streptomyces TaxID=2593676 RepID=UPI0039A3C1FB
MTHDLPLTPSPSDRFPEHVRRDDPAAAADSPPPLPDCRVTTARVLRAHGVTSLEAAEHSRPGGPWRMLLPDVFLLRADTPTSQDRLRAVLLHASTSCAPADPHDGAPGPAALITGAAALALHGFTATPPLTALNRIDVLVPGSGGPRSTGFARVVHRGSGAMPAGTVLAGVPVAPVHRALADAVAHTDDPQAVRALLTEAVEQHHCEPGELLDTLAEAGLLSTVRVAGAVDDLVAAGRSVAEGRLYELVRTRDVPQPCWNVELRLPGGPFLGGVDAYWPDQAVAVSIDAPLRCRATGALGAAAGEDLLGDAYAQQREVLERFGITVVHLTPGGLREAPEHQAAVVRTALAAAADREPATELQVLPR